MSKRTGRHSAQQNDFLQPSNVVITSATDVGTGRPYLATANGTAGQGGAVQLVWTLDANSTPATSYDITTTPTTVTKNTTTIPTGESPFVFEGLASGTEYTFTVYAKNNAGSASGTTSSSVVATTVPAPPSAPSVVNYSNDQNDYVSWSEPSNAGKSITSYNWESTDSKSGSTTAPTTSATVSQEANTSQQYRVKATNANGTSDWSPYSGGNTTPPFFPPYFPFFPFFPPYFPYFPFFPFFPPFFPFFPFFPHFPPFFPFFPFFPPRFCIEESTLVETPTGLVAAKDLKVGDVLVSVELNEMSTEPREEENFIIAPTLSFAGGNLVETTITDIIESEKSEIVYFNGNDKAKYSNEQAMFAKIDGQFQTLNAGMLKVGDILVKVLKDGSYVEEEITAITSLDEPTIVYQYICEPYNWFIAGGYLVHQN